MIRFLAMHTPAGGDTLETGAGLTTVLFVALGGRHISITPDRGKSDRILAFCQGEGISTDSLKFVTARSEDALPTLNCGGYSGAMSIGVVGSTGLEMKITSRLASFSTSRRTCEG
jgi:hypothetical protein